ncbi:MAG: glycoside hydrolase family 95 protein [Chitinophagaceae bacterium]|nr:glycoside hydrolase family 95 protein [Chitinophagaceae bacterium]MCW5928259.1 glycoside hydrolase family 95 protein [Chitinophagaceae bacterium]
MTSRLISPFLFLALILTPSLTVNAQSQLRLWYNKPANSSVPDGTNAWESDSAWLGALPVGNGYLGAMVFGDVNKERIQINEKTLWSGSPDDNDNPVAADSVGIIRNLLFEGRYKEAGLIANRTQICKGAGSAHGNAADYPYGCFQTLGDIRFNFGSDKAFSNYKRELDLNKGIVIINYIQNGIRFTREVFASYPDRAIVIRITADKKAVISFTATLTRPERFSTTAQKDHLLMKGALKNGKGGDGLQYAARFKAIAKGGTVSYNNGHVIVNKADEVVLILTAGTNYK